MGTFLKENSVHIAFAPFCKMVFLKRKQFAPFESKFSAFRVDPF